MPELPPLEFGEHLIGHLMRVGPTLSGGMGPVPVSNLELRAWQDNYGIELSPWECDWLIRLSREWIGEQQTACKHFAPAPWTPDGGMRP